MPGRDEEVEFPAALGSIARRVESRICELLSEERHRWTAVDPVLAEPLDALTELVTAGGKRLRPAFCYCAFVGAGGDPDDARLVDAAAAIELVHTFALVHDDVMDGSPTRRGVDAVHRRFADAHGAAGWRGEARRFGDGFAILVGDFAFVYADRLVRGLPPTALAVFDDLRVELCVGQSLDLAATARGVADRAGAHRIAEYKSGRYTVERPLHLGAALAGRLDDLEAPLHAIGDPLGRAFQLRDDLLGAFGDPVVTGKPVGDDLREGKTTPLLVALTERAGEADRALLARVGAGDLDDVEVKRLHELALASGAVAEIEGEIDRLVHDARAAIAAAPLGDTAQALLHDLAGYVAWRDR